MRKTVVATCLVLLSTACGGSDTSGAIGDDGVLSTTASPAAPAAPLDCERLGYPCDWREADPAVLERSLDLLDTAAELLDSGLTPEEAARSLEGETGVVATNWAPEGVVFRLDGGLPVTAFTALASPISLPTDSGGSAAPSMSPTQVSFDLPLGRAVSTDIALQAANSSSYEPTRDPDIRPRRVMVLSPTRFADHAAAIEASAAAGLPIPVAAPTATRDAFQNSEHFEVLDLPDSLADMSHWASMRSFDVVVIETHGAYYEPDGSDDVSGLFLAGPLAAPYLADLELTAEEAAYKDFGAWTVARLSIDDQYHISFKDDFFRLGGSGVGETIVMVNACRMGEEQVSTTALASSIAGSRGAVYSWDTAVPRNSADATTAYLAALLADGADAAAAIQQMRFDEEDTATYEGITATLQLYQESSHNLRARDVATTFVEGAVAEPGVRISANGTPDDGNDDRIENVEIRIDAVNRGAEDTTKVTIEVDGRPLKVMLDGAPVEEIYLSERTVREGAESRGAWRHHRVDLNNAILPFDLEDADVTQGRGHVWEVTVQGASGEPTIHRIENVIFRLGSVRILNPNTAFPVTMNEEVFIDGEADDGEPERYDLIVRVEHLAQSANLSEYTVELTFDTFVETLQLTAFAPGGDGVFAYEREVDVGDFSTERKPVPISAVLTRTTPEAGAVIVDDFDPEQIVLVLDDSGPGDATIVVGGQAWEFELVSIIGSTCILDDSSLIAAGAVDGDLNGVTFSAELTTEGGQLTVVDPDGDAQWMADADRAGMTVLHELPAGQSQIDSITFEGRTIKGMATFIETRAFLDAWLNNGTYPAPVTGSFEIRCPAGS